MLIGPRYRERFTPSGSENIVLGRYRNYHGTLNPYGPSFIDKPRTEWVTQLAGSPIPKSSLYERCWDFINPGPPYLSGGALTSAKAYLPTQELKGHGRYSSPRQAADYWVYEGGFGVPDFVGDPLQTSHYTTLGINQQNFPLLFPSLEALGSGAYSKLRPGIEKAGLGVALAEARDLPRMMKTTSSGFHDIWRNLSGHRSQNAISMPRNKASEHYLNTQFGWVPFLSDLEKFHKVYDNAAAYMAQLARDNGQWIKRIRTDKTISSETLLSTWNGYRIRPVTYPISTIYTTGPAQARLIERYTTYIWYEGRFKYYRPEFDWTKGRDNSWPASIRRHMTLYGARISPSIIYQATPWSWLADWFTNVGDTIQRASDWAFDGMVSKYMYLMHHHLRELILQQDIYVQGELKTLEWSRFCDIKRRVNANSHYGFNLSPDALTGRQLSILGALGLSRIA